ncbi:hypothetical protein [uncultured Polaribacter sp.]|uniref:hypothetical protein n=1 Tax=uncultured Polaribacter sp. TaxID=174711 RepID=UPI00259B509A|nr:hypothetical protein [uncultured Polaribacter sp.]
MKKALKIFFVSLLISATLFLMWIVSLFFGLPLLPYMETNYYLKEDKISLNKKKILKINDSISLGIEIPNYFPEEDQCIDFWFFNEAKQRSLNIKNFALTLKNLKKEKQLIEKDIIIFWDGGYNENKPEVKNFILNKGCKYIFIRNIYDLNKAKKSQVHIKLNYFVNRVEYKFDTIINITKEKELTWNKLRAH